MTHVSDEFLSAYIDGEAPSADAAAHLDGCGACESRLAALRGVSVAIALPVDLPAAHVREAAFMAALQKPTGPTTTARPTLLRRANALSAAAVLLVALGVGAVALTQLGGGDNTSTTQSATAGDRALDMQTESATAPSNELSSPMRVDDSAAGGGIARAIPDAGGIGAFDTTEPIVARYRAFAADPNSVTTMLRELPCPVADGQPVDWHASLTYNGEEAYARVLSLNGQPVRLEVLRRTTCEVLATQMF